ncbi:MAG: MG2 domain-containing protein [Fibromonadales bacterium]|nr:MG2 domain-containing protein [Fibromonadales bacterium]
MIKLLPLLLIPIFLSCGQKDQGKQPPRNLLATELTGQNITLTEFISAKPATVLSSRSAIEFEFNRNMVINSAVNENLDVNPIEFEPAVKGKAKWLTTSLIQFTPDEPMQSGKTYKAKFNGKKAFGPEADVDDYTFEFEIIPNEILEINGGFEPMVGKVNTAKLVLEMRFADRPDSARLAKELTLNFNSRNMPFKMSFGGDGKNVVVSSEELSRTDRNQSAEISLPKHWTAFDKPFSETFLLPARGTFMAVSSKEAEVVFSDPIATNMDVSGFVSVSPNINFSVSVKNRTLKLKGDFAYGTQYTLRIEKGFPSAYGTKTLETYIQEFSFDDEKPQLSWVGSGLFLPLENKGRLQIKSINIDGAKIEIQEVLPQNLMFFLQNNELRSSNRWFSDIERTTKRIYEGDIRFENPKRNEWLKTEIDISKYFAKKAGAAYIVTLKFSSQNLITPCDNTISYDYDHPCHYYFYYGDRANSEKILIASSVALTAKKDSKGTHVWATDVESSKAVSGLTLELFDRVNDVLATQKTDGNGYAFFSAEGGYVIKGQGNRGLALIKLSQENWETSRFDVGGVRENNNSARLFSYTERGVYRPGDTIHFSGIARTLPNMQMSISVKNPLGADIFESSAKTSASGMFSVDIPTDLNAPTGEWTATIKSGGNEWRHYISVETIKPNRLKNTLTLPEKMTGSQIRIDQRFGSKYLFGTPAAGLKAELNYSLQNRALKFLRFPDFTFKNQMLHFEEDGDEILFRGNLNSEGEARLNQTINLRNKNVPEALNLKIHATVHENGGGFTESWHSSVLYPYPVFVGLKKRDSWDGIRIGDTLRLPYIALDENGKIVSGRNLSVKIYQNRNYSWWEGGSSDRWDFRKQKQTYLVHEETLKSGTAVKEFKWSPDGHGMLAIEFTDVDGGHSVSQFIYASHWGGSENIRNIPEASHLNLMSKKSTYNIGDSILISFEAPANGHALVTMEYSNTILETKLVQAKAGKNEVHFMATKNMLPNVYAVVSLFLPLKNVEGEKPMRYYGILPINVHDENTKLNLALKTPQEIKPGDDFTIEVTNNSKENASFTLAIVDEGLLDLTNFKTPDPWKFYFQKLALSILSSDNYDEIIGALMQDMDSYLSIGGDDEMSAMAGQQKVQRFKAVSLFSGVREVKGGKTEKITFTMPQYVGSVRAMLIGVSPNAFSKAEADIPVKQPLMILPTVPRAAKPGDKFKVPVSVFAMNDDIKNVTVNLQVSSELKITGKSSFALSFEKTGELDGSFDVETLPNIGSAKVIVSATSGKHKTADTIDLPVMSASAIYTEVEHQQISAGDVWQTRIKAFGIDNTHKATLVLSTLPSLSADERLDYLINYPYGCLEQTVSSMFPQLYIDKFRDLDSKAKQDITININDGIKRLALFSMSNGFSYWPNQSDRGADSWATSYAGHFMLEAKSAGYSIPQNLMNTWKTWEIEQSKRVHNASGFRNQAYRLFLLAMAGEEQTGAMNLMKENNLENLDWLSKHLLAGAYHVSGKESIAKQVLEFNGPALSNYRESSGSYGSSLRDQALAALVLAKMNRFKEALDIYQILAKDWNSRSWWSTQESAFALLAFSALREKFSGGDVEVQYNNKKVIVKANKPVKVDLTSLGSADLSVEAMNGTIFAELQTRGLPIEDYVKTENKGLVVERFIISSSGERMYPSQINQGESFWLLFGVRSLAPSHLENLALSSILPSSFEISNERLNEYSRPAWMNNYRIATPDYMDIRDDRVNWFFDISPGATKVFYVQVHPSFAGEFRWPGLVVEAMYSPDYYARIAGERVNVR